MAERPLRVLIYGSCVSRDAFELFEPDDGVELVEYVARSSIVSAMSKRPFSGVDTTAIASQFRRRMVAWDLESTKLKELVAAGGYDILLLDVIDERYGLYQRDSETFATRSSEFGETGFAKTTTERAIAPHTAERLRLWRRGWRRLRRRLKRAGKLQAVRLNKVFWATKLSSGADHPSVAANPTAHDLVNGMIGQMYRRIERDLGPDQVYRYPASDLVADVDHKWGAAPFHYPPSYNQRLKAYLLAERERVCGSAPRTRT
ncbi:MAG: DUF6270 domain-containing protein [Bifidobacteriaceae bacterium]|nr:DUF6270 domain-containing protein [Bifidobacteriaceae bacterium]